MTLICHAKMNCPFAQQCLWLGAHMRPQGFLVQLASSWHTLLPGL
jgi:hypothetical protein